MAFYVKIVKQTEKSASVMYSFWSVPESVGTLEIDKTSGEVTLLSPLKGDEQERVFMRAAVKLRREWQEGRLPDSTEWAS